MAMLTCGCGAGSNDVRCPWHARQAERAVTSAAIGGYMVDARAHTRNAIERVLREETGASRDTCRALTTTILAIVDAEPSC